MKRVHLFLACCILILSGCSSAPKLLVKSDPPGADIYVDGVIVGKTPAALELTFSETIQLVMEKKILAVKLPGYKERKEVISQESANNKTLEIALAPEVAEIVALPVVSRPSVTAVRESKAVPEVVSSPSATVITERKASLALDSSPSITTRLEQKPAQEVSFNTAEQKETDVRPAADSPGITAVPPVVQETAPATASDKSAIPALQTAQ